MPFMVTQASSVMMSSPSPVNGAQDLHENLLHWRCGIPGLSNQTELNYYITCMNELISDHLERGGEQNNTVHEVYGS